MTVFWFNDFYFRRLFSRRSQTDFSLLFEFWGQNLFLQNVKLGQASLRGHREVLQMNAFSQLRGDGTTESFAENKLAF